MIMLKNMSKKLNKFLKKIIEYGFYLFVFILPWQTKLILRSDGNNFQEISLYLSHFLLLIVLITFFIYKFKHRSEEEKISVLWLALAVLELSVLISFFFAADQVLAFYYYVTLLLAVALFYLLREETTNLAYEDIVLDKITIFYYFFSSIFLQALLGIYQFITQKSIAFKYLGLASHAPGFLGSSVIETSSGRWLRAYGGLDHPNILGGVLAISLIITVYLLAKRKMIRSKQEALSSILLFIFYFVSLFALFFTFSRSAWLALGVGLLVLLITFIFAKDRWVLGRFITLMFFSLVMIFMVAYPYRDLLQVRVDGGTRLETKSIIERESYIVQSEGVIKHNILFGVGTGTGNYTEFLRSLDKIKKDQWSYQPVHNAFLLLWAESGAFAFIAFIVFILCLLIKDRREPFASAIIFALIILMLFDHWLLSLPFGIIFLFLILGLI